MARIRHIALVVKDLEKTESGRPTIPDGFQKIWGPISEAREALRGS